MLKEEIGAYYASVTKYMQPRVEKGYSVPTDTVVDLFQNLLRVQGLAQANDMMDATLECLSTVNKLCASFVDTEKFDPNQD